MRIGAAGDSDVVVVTRTERIADELARGGQRAISFARLRQSLLVHLAPDVSFATDLVCRLALARTSPPGVAARVHEALGLLREANVSHEAVEGVAGRARRLTLFDVPETAAARARILVEGARALAAVLHGLGLEDPRAADALLSERIAGTDPVALAERVGLRLEARGLLDPAPAALAWYAGLDARLGRLGGFARVTVPHVPMPVDAARERTPFEVVADDLARALAEPPLPMNVAPPLGAGTFAGPLDAGVEARVGLTRVVTADHQAEAVVALVSRALDAGAAIDRIVIVTPRADEATLAPLRAELERARLPFVSPTAPLSGTPVLAFFTRFLSLGASLDRDTLALLLASRHVSAAALAETDDGRAAARSLPRLVRFLEGVRVPRGHDAPAALLELGSTYAAAGPEPRDPLVPAILSRLSRLLAPLASPRARRELLAAVRGLAAGLGVARRAVAGATEFFASDDAPDAQTTAEIRAVAEDGRAWEVFAEHVDAFERAAVLCGVADDVVSPAELLYELASTLPGSPPRSGQRAGALRVMGLAEAAGESLDLAVVVDAVLGGLPREGEPEALVSDTLANEIDARAGGGLLRREAGRRPRDLAHLLLLSASSRRLELVYPTTDADGGGAAPSFVVSWLARGGIPISAARRRAGLPVDPSILLRAQREALREAFFLDPARRPSPERGRLSGEAVLGALCEETGGGERALAATSIERFATCPFQGFAHEVLRARDLVTTQDRMDAREEGSLLHDALAAAFSAAGPLLRARPRDVPAIVARGTAAARAVLASPDAGLFAVDRGRMLGAVRGHLELAAADDAWDFSRAEQAFGGHDAGEWPPLSLADGAARLLVRGRIDRLDVGRYRSVVRAIDYKRSRGTGDASQLGETRFQVPLYARAAQREMGLEACDGAYFPVSPRHQAEPTAVKKGFRERFGALVRADAGELAPVERAALDVVLRVRAGAVTPTPRHETACRTCSADGGCRRPRYTMSPEE